MYPVWRLRRLILEGPSDAAGVWSTRPGIQGIYSIQMHFCIWNGNLIVKWTICPFWLDGFLCTVDGHGQVLIRLLHLQTILYLPCMHLCIRCNFGVIFLSPVQHKQIFKKNTKQASNLRTTSLQLQRFHANLH